MNIKSKCKPRKKVATRYIFVMAPPASGKTTVINILSKCLRDKKLRVEVINDKEVLYNMCQQKSSEEYFFAANGELVLLDDCRELILEKVFERLSRCLEEVSRDVDICLFEFTSPNWYGVLQKYFSGLLRKNECMGLTVLSSGKNIKRNQERKDSEKIPDGYMKLFGVEASKQLMKSKGSFGNFWTIDNVGDLDRLKNQCCDLVGKII